MSLTCILCNKKFNSNNNLQKHMNRQVPCNIVIQCVRCEKIFNRQIDLDKHSKRKFPCILKTSKSEIDFEHEKMRLELEMKNKLILMNTQAQIAKEASALKTADELIKKEKDAQVAKEKMILKSELDMKKEDAKTKRKEITAKMINEKNTRDKLAQAQVEKEAAAKERRDYMKIMEDVLNVRDMITTFKNVKNSRIEYIKKFIRTKEFKEELIEIYNTGNNFKELVSLILQAVFSDKNRPERQNIFYLIKYDEFYYIGADPNPFDKNGYKPCLKLISTDSELKDLFDFLKKSVIEALQWINDYLHLDKNMVSVFNDNDKNAEVMAYLDVIMYIEGDCGEHSRSKYIKFIQDSFTVENRLVRINEVTINDITIENMVNVFNDNVIIQPFIKLIGI